MERALPTLKAGFLVQDADTYTSGMYPHFGLKRKSVPTPSDIVLLRRKVMNVKTHHVGPWVVNLSQEGVFLPDVTELEHLINEKYLWVAQEEFARYYPIKNFSMREWGIPSPVIRVDMPPYDASGIQGVYEIEANPASLGLCAHYLDLGLVRPIAEFLRSEGIGRIGYEICLHRKDEEEDHELFLRELRECDIDVANMRDTSDTPLWLRAGQEDIPDITHLLPRCLLMHYHGGGNKNYLRSIDNAHLLSEFSHPHDPFEFFPEGFSLKPIRGWGVHDVKLWVPHQPYKRRSHPHKKMKEVLFSRYLEGDHWIVQKFHPPEERESRRVFRIWKVIAVFDGERYNVVGGYWNDLPSMLLHGAKDAVMGPIYP